MSKKMWHKIFKSKSQKQQQQLNKINKRHSRGIYEEYQQLNELLAGEKVQQQQNCCNENLNENGNGNSNINVFEQQPQQSSFNSKALSEAQQQQQQQQQQSQRQHHLSTFSRVRNTFSLRRNSNNNNNNKNNNNKNNKQTPNAKSSESDMPPLTTKATTMITTTTMATSTNLQLQHVLFVVNKIDQLATNNLHASTFNSSITDTDTLECDDGEDLDFRQLPGPLTTGQTIPLEEEAVSDVKPSDLTPCPCCSRTFNVSALRKHVVICEKSSKKRKVFDSSRQRREGTSLSTYVLPKNFGLPNAERAAGVHTPPAINRELTQQPVVEVLDTPKPTRRNPKVELVRRGSVRKDTSKDRGTSIVAPAARSLTKRGKDTGDRCPHCERTFNPKAFDRHVEWCKEKAVQNAIKIANSTETTKAKERMEARKQYKPPNLKTKRSMNRDKYSGHEEVLEAGDMMPPKINVMGLSSMTSSVQSENLQKKASQQTGKMTTTGGRQGRRGSSTLVTENALSLGIINDEDLPSPPVHRSVTMQRAKRRQHVNETCNQIDETMMRVKCSASREALPLSKLDNDNLEVAARPAKGKLRKAHSNHENLEKVAAMSPEGPVTMHFEELNGLMNRKGGTPICNEQDVNEKLKLSSKSRSSTSLVRQARRRVRTREHPSIEMRTLKLSGATVPSRLPTDLMGVAKITTTDQMDCSLLPMGRRLREMLSGSDDEGTEIQIKLETSTTRTLCRPKKRSNQLPLAIGCAEPMRALPMPHLKESLNALSQNISQDPVPCLELEIDELDLDLDNDSMSDEEEIQTLPSPVKRKAKSRSSKRDLEELKMEDKEMEPVKLPPLVRQGSNVSRRLVVLEEDENGKMYIKEALPGTTTKHESRTRPSSGRNRAKSGDKYDPFLSAKRQLEELCSPSTPPLIEEKVIVTTPLTTPNISMTTSLTNSISKPVAASTPKVIPISNFRRTSSLRGPRRTPLLPSRPFFATNYRPTIQRGLSDEGPISSNFLKPEEFDEMPVRAACVNDFHSPRVVRRDTSASNRKQQLKLPLTSGSNNGDPESAAPGRNVAKTDSLAVFLKYEHDLEQQLNAKAAEMTSKELKDKSNNLSKQNSAKSLVQPGQLPVLSPPTTAPITTPISSIPVKEKIDNVPRTFPLISKPSTLTATPSSGTTSSSNTTTNTTINTPIKLENIFIDPKLINACDNLHLGNRLPSDTNTTTPQQLGQSHSRSSSQSTITHERRHSGEARNLLKRKMRLGRNQFLYDASPEEAYASSGCCSADDEANRSSMEYDEQCWQQQQKQLLANPLPLPPVMSNIGHNLMPSFDNFDFEEFLSSFENENDEEQFPLFRDCREFLMNRTKRSGSKSSYTATPQTTMTGTPIAINNIIKSNSAHRCDSSDEKLMRQQSNVSSISSNDEKQKENNKEKRMTDQQKREIFISIETETNDQGRSPISPDSLRHMVGNPQTKIDVLHIENGNEPEHAKFSKISDTDEADGESGFGDKVKQQQLQQQQQQQLPPLTSSTNLLGANGTPNVQLNNAKNLIQQMQSDFRQLGEDASASMRRAMSRTEEPTKERQHDKPPMDGKTSSPSGDSDEFSSLDGYPMSSSHSSRRGGASSKLSSDSAYGSSNSPYSLSRRSSELATNSPRSVSMLRPHTANAKLMDASTQAQIAYGTLKARQRLFPAGPTGDGNPDDAESSSSGSDNSPKNNNNKQQAQQQQQQQQQSQINNYNYQQQQQTLSNANSNSNNNNNNNNLLPTPTTSQQSLLSSNSSMTSSMKMSKFCHECGGKFVIEHAKFCMECGVRRVVL